MARTPSWAAFGLLAAVSALAVGDDRNSDRYGIGLGEKGALAVRDGRVIVTASREAGIYDLWRIGRTERGLTIRPFGGRWRQHYLTGDAEGNVFLSERPTEGSYWDFRFRTDEHSESRIRLPGLEVGPRCLTVGECETPGLSREEGPRFTFDVIAP